MKTMALKYYNDTPPCIIEVSNDIWAGKVALIPRNQIDLYRTERESTLGGVYLLLNDTDIYIGKAGVRANNNGLLGRIIEHKESWWHTCILVTKTTNNGFSLDSQAVLENKLTRLAQHSTYTVRNRNTPPTTEVTSEDKSHITYILLALRSLGVYLDNYQPEQQNVQQQEQKEKERTFLYLRGRNDIFNAVGYETDNGFVVKKGSVIKPLGTEVSSIREKTKHDRIAYADKLDNNILAEDILFSSASLAAGFVTAARVSGPKRWKNSEGTPLQLLHASK